MHTKEYPSRKRKAPRSVFFTVWVVKTARSPTARTAVHALPSLPLFTQKGQLSYRARAIRCHYEVVHRRVIFHARGPLETRDMMTPPLPSKEPRGTCVWSHRGVV